MTPQTDHTAAAVDGMLLDAGLEQDGELRRVLLAVTSLADLPVPPPSGELAALLSVDPAGETSEEDPHQGNEGTVMAVDDLGRRRRLRAHRTTVAGLALVAGMGMGVGTVAASSTGPAKDGSPSVQQLLEDWAPSWTLRSPADSVPGFLQAHDNDGDGGDVRGHGGGPAGHENVLAQDPPEDLPSSEPSLHAPAPEAREEGRQEPGQLPAVHGQDGGDAPEKNASGGSQGTAAGVNGAARPDPASGTGSGNASPAGHGSGQGAGPAPGVLPEAGQGPGAQGGGAASGPKPVPGAKWLEKFGR
ncbi:hypothetical protein CXX84_11030 [Arthrobacter sp. AFG7.2]|uniref:hypothetical protein n=1 Tax=Arthrobacter sp. AFG7.2 TaxID=1688693 RepID=UPI000C9E339B|nr:hypothetical protein [Arthrobacter sp. AFG7.2]PNI08448.1 hypothetical protein CXX84_11030 [Arthrobacter sp. AFG7.2]